MDTTGYTDDNVFAKILRGEMPAAQVYEDDAVIAIMDVMPQATGHTLVIPRAASRNLLDADAATLGPAMAAVQKVARAAKAAFAADGVTIMQLNEPAAGQVVFHLHFHIIPRFEGVALKRHAEGMEDPAVLVANAAKIRQALG